MIDLAVRSWLEIPTSSSGLSQKQLLGVLFSALSAGLTSLCFNLTHMRRYLDAMPHRDESGNKSGQRWNASSSSDSCVLMRCLCRHMHLRSRVCTESCLYSWCPESMCASKVQERGLGPHLDIKVRC